MQPHGSKAVGAEITSIEIALKLWQGAAQIDPTLSMRSRLCEPLLKKQIRATRFSWDRLYQRMVRGEPSLFSGFNVPVQQGRSDNATDAIVNALLRSEGGSRWRVSKGADQQWTRMPVSEFVLKWRNANSIVSVTDLPLRGTPLKKRIDTSSIERANVLASPNENIAEQEMLTLVMSSAGSYTDSHSDAPDGWNRCFEGKKLWLVWETFEGLGNGLEDIERSDVYETAAFDIRTFVDLPSARWFLVEQGQTLFLPANYTHKVVTLKRYIGIGSFVVLPAAYLRNLLHWKKHRPLWESGEFPQQNLGLVQLITQAVTRRIRRLAKQRIDHGDRCGLERLHRAVKRWHRDGPANEKQLLMSDAVSKKFLTTVGNTSKSTL